MKGRSGDLPVCKLRCLLYAVLVARTSLVSGVLEHFLLERFERRTGLHRASGVRHVAVGPETRICVCAGAFPFWLT